MPNGEAVAAGARKAGAAVGNGVVGSVLFLVLAALFLASGAAGLVYQVAWVKILSLVFGVTVHAVSAVLAGFMLGLATGSFLAGRYADRVKNPIIVYGLVEIGIGISGLLTPWAFGQLRDSYPNIHDWATDLSVAVGAVPGLGSVAGSLPDVIRLLLAFGILLIPTTLMGATLPIMLKSSLLTKGALGRTVGGLYAINTFGAILGTVGAGYFLIADAGVQGAIQTAAAINISVGLAAIILALLVSLLTASRSLPIGQSAVFIGFGLSGLFALGYEVIWFRLLSLFFENITYSFTIMLATVLFGIAVGSLVLAPLLSGIFGRIINWWIVFAVLELGIAVCALLSITVLGRVNEFAEQLAALEQLAFILSLEDATIVLTAFVAIVPAMFLSGMTFPVAAQIFASGGEKTATKIGSLYAANTVGAIFGSTIAGFVLIPTFASQRSLVLLAAGSALVAALVLWAAPNKGTPWYVKIALTAVGVWAFVSVYRGTPDLYENLLATRFPGQEVVYYREGLESSVTVVKNPVDGITTLYSNSRGQANDEIGLVTFHRLLGHMPMLVHPSPKRVLIVGIGGGTTAGAVAQHPGAQVDAVELSDAVIDGVRFFGAVNYNVADLPNVTIIQNDARNHLLVSGQKYDVISGDAIRPNDAGSVALYSADYYRLAKAALNDDGLMTQWLPPFSEYQYKLILRTFTSVFPYVTIWQSGDLIIGSKSPISIDRRALAARWADPTLRQALTDSGVTGPDDFLARFNAANDEVRARAGDGPVITDDRPYIEYFRSLPKDDPPKLTGFSHDLRQIVR